MYQKKAAIFFYTVSPVHLGAGTATGIIDNPIQRERHTNHPVFAGSGIKGAVRHGFAALGGDATLEDRIFGPRDGNLHAGAMSFGDAQLVAFPVRSLKRGYVYTTSSHALARTKRLLDAIGATPHWTIPSGVSDGVCVVSESQVLSQGKLHLEAFEYSADDSSRSDVAALAKDLASRAVPESGGHEFFRDKITSDFAVLSEADFGYFSEHATLVEPHVRINDATGTAESGGLFYTENLPPESILVAPLFATSSRDGREPKLSARDVLRAVREAIDGKLLQIGGDATTGRGLVTVSFCQGI